MRRNHARKRSKQATNKLIKTIDKGMGSRMHIRLSRFLRPRFTWTSVTSTRQRTGSGSRQGRGIAIPVELYGELISALKEAEPLIKALPPVKKEEE